MKTLADTYEPLQLLTELLEELGIAYTYAGQTVFFDEYETVIQTSATAECKLIAATLNKFGQQIKLFCFEGTAYFSL